MTSGRHSTPGGFPEAHDSGTDSGADGRKPKADKELVRPSMAGVYVRHRFADHRHEGLGRRLCYTVSVVDTPGAKYGPAAHEPIAVYAGYGNTPDATGFKFIAWSLVEEIEHFAAGSLDLAHQGRSPRNACGIPGRRRSAHRSPSRRGQNGHNRDRGRDGLPLCCLGPWSDNGVWKGAQGGADILTGRISGASLLRCWWRAWARLPGSSRPCLRPEGVPIKRLGRDGETEDD
jgi:hypothetical protein